MDRGSQPGSLSWAYLVRPPRTCQVNCRQARGPQQWGVCTGLRASSPTFIGEQTSAGSDGREVTLDQDTPGRSWEGPFLPPQNRTPGYKTRKARSLAPRTRLSSHRSSELVPTASPAPQSEDHPGL